MVAVLITIIAVLFVTAVLIYTAVYCLFALGDNADDANKKDEETVVDGEDAVSDTPVEKDFWRWLRVETAERELRRSRTVGDLDKLRWASSQAEGRRKRASFMAQKRYGRNISPSVTALGGNDIHRFKPNPSALGPLEPCWVAERRAHDHSVNELAKKAAQQAQALEKRATQQALTSTPPKVFRQTDCLPRAQKLQDDMYYYRPGIQLVVEAIVESKKGKSVPFKGDARHAQCETD